MTRFTKTAAGAALLGLLAFAACKKESTDPAGDRTRQRTAWLTDTTWSLTYIGLDYNRDGIIDAPLPGGAVAPCALDNVYDFSENGSGMMHDSTQRCDTALPVNVPFQWAYADNGNAMDITGATFYGLNGRFKVWEIGEGRLTLARDTMVTIAQVPQPVTSSIVVHLRP